MKFKTLAECFEKLEATTKRLEITAILADLFSKASESEIKKVIYLLQNQVEPPFKGVEIGMGEKFVERAIANASGFDINEVEKVFRKTGDLGETGAQFASKRMQSSLLSRELSVDNVYDNFYKMAKTGGEGSQLVKIKLLTELIMNATPVEGKYIVRIPLGKMRLGIGDPTILDALSVKEKGTKEMREELERAYNLCSDLGLVAEAFYNDGLNGLKKFRITPGNPIRPMAGERVRDANEIIERLGKCAVEGKFDGLRIQCHKKGNSVWLFSRHLENLTNMFPELVAEIKKQECSDMIFEGEALLYNEKEKTFKPFQETIQRRRKHGIYEMSKQYPLTIFAFDMLYADGKDLTNEPYQLRRKTLESKIKPTKTIKLADRIITDDPKELQKYFEESVKRGLEGIFAKDLNAVYTAGARKFAWIKLKKSYQGQLADTVDVVILGYYKGKGKRTEFGFGGFLAGVYDNKTDTFKTITRVGTGFTEDQMTELETELSKLKVSKKPARVESEVDADIWVEPVKVVTLIADEITKSPLHTAGYALRFPRLVSKTFVDKEAEQATTLKELLTLYRIQTGEDV